MKPLCSLHTELQCAQRLHPCRLQYRKMHKMIGKALITGLWNERQIVQVCAGELALQEGCSSSKKPACSTGLTRTHASQKMQIHRIPLAYMRSLGQGGCLIVPMGELTHTVKMADLCKGQGAESKKRPYLLQNC